MTTKNNTYRRANIEKALIKDKLQLVRGPGRQSKWYVVPNITYLECDTLDELEQWLAQREKHAS